MKTMACIYDEAIARGDIENDPLQRDVLVCMQRLADDLVHIKHSWFHWRSGPVIQGLYLYGPVGVGKTYLVDLFYHQLGERKKARFHFHHFMQQIDKQLRQLQGQKNPVRQIVKNLAKSTRVLCFDEFLVHDVAYAMILSDLLQELVAHGVVLVVSSNTSPDELYLNGVQRARFLPAIAAIKSHCEVLHLDEKRDYRLGRSPLLDAYLQPLNHRTQEIMTQQFALLEKKIDLNKVINIQNRDIPFLQCGERTIWFDFNVICNLPRSQLDYLDIAARFDAVFISAIPALTERYSTQAILFIHFIDVMYDQGIKVILCAAVPVDQLYVKGEMQEAFKRTLSRLIEMQSADYLSRHPRRIVQDMV